jgi:hypothetical protein
MYCSFGMPREIAQALMTWVMPITYFIGTKSTNVVAKELATEATKHRIRDKIDLRQYAQYFFRMTLKLEQFEKGSQQEGVLK